MSSILRNFFEEYRTIKFIIVLVNYSDLFLTIFLCVIHFPKELPPLFMEQIIMEEPDFNINDVENNKSCVINPVFGIYSCK